METNRFIFNDINFFRFSPFIVNSFISIYIMETHDIGWGRITSLMVQRWQPLKYGFDRYPQPASTELS